MELMSSGFSSQVVPQHVNPRLLYSTTPATKRRGRQMSPPTKKH